MTLASEWSRIVSDVPQGFLELERVQRKSKQTNKRSGESKRWGNFTHYVVVVVITIRCWVLIASSPECKLLLGATKLYNKRKCIEYIYVQYNFCLGYGNITQMTFFFTSFYFRMNTSFATKPVWSIWAALITMQHKKPL